MGGSLFAALAAVSRLSQQGYPVQAMESAELLHYGSASLRAADLGVVISRSGGSIEPVQVAEKMRQAGMTVIGVTNVPGSELEQLADINLHIGAQADKLIAVQTYTGTVLTLLLLAEEVLTGQSAQLSDACGAALPALSTHIEECLRASDDWQGLLMGAPLYLLGRGPALGSVYEGAAAVARNREDGRSRHVLRAVSARTRGDSVSAISAPSFSVRLRLRRRLIAHWPTISSPLARKSAGLDLRRATVALTHRLWFPGRRLRRCSHRCSRLSPCRWPRTGWRCGAASLPATFVSSPRSRPPSLAF